MPIDPRILKLGIVIDGKINWYTDLFIEAKGTKFNNPSGGQCEITILNLSREKREYILRETRPQTATGKRVSVILEAGRASYGTSTVYTGDVFRSEATPKPDIGVRLKCIAGQFNKNKLVSRSGSEKTKLSQIAQWCADDAGYGLSFEITDRFIQSYSFTGSAQNQISQLQALSGSDVYVENDILYLKPSGVPAGSLPVLNLRAKTGLIEIGGTESGMKCKFLFNPIAAIGTRVDAVSETNPSLNGSYEIMKLNYEITNRAQPFYYVAECRQI